MRFVRTVFRVCVAACALNVGGTRIVPAAKQSDSNDL